MRGTFPEKHTVGIGGLVLEYVSSGSGSPAIVLVNGAGGPIEGWHKVYPLLQQMSTVIAYNRLGVGGSSKPSEPQTGDVIVRTLRELLAQVDLSPPYVLVGHSLGGLFVNLYARLHPDEVAGVALLETAAPEDVALAVEHSTAAQRLAQRFMDALPGRAELSETEYVSDTVDLIARAGPFPHVPLVVLTGGRPSWMRPKALSAARAEHQSRLTSLSPKGRQVIAGRSGHFPQMTEPAIVVEAIRGLITLATPGP